MFFVRFTNSYICSVCPYTSSYGFDMGRLSTGMTDDELKDTIKNYNLLYIQKENNNNMRKEEENA